MRIPALAESSPISTSRTVRSPKSGIPLGYRTRTKPVRISDNPTGYQLTLTPLAGKWSAPPVQRLRALLKRALRDYGLRCIQCRPSNESGIRPHTDASSRGRLQTSGDPSRTHELS